MPGRVLPYSQFFKTKSVNDNAAKLDVYKGKCYAYYTILFERSASTTTKVDSPTATTWDEKGSGKREEGSGTRRLRKLEEKNNNIHTRPNNLSAPLSAGICN